MKYQRFVAYVYEYRKGKKEENCGFLRVETRNDNVTVEVHIKCPGLPADENCSVYGFVRKAGLLEGILLGSAWSGVEKLDCMIDSEKAENVSWKSEFQQFGGMIIRTDNGAFFGTEWDDQPIKPENFEPKRIAEVQKKIEIDDNVFQTDTQKEVTYEADTEIALESKCETKQDDSDSDLTMASAQENFCEEPQPNNPPTFCPFNDDEISECRKIHPNDLFKSCPRTCAFRNNRFLEHGYYNFGHLLVGRRADGQRILGVPGGYDQQERFMANMFGFPYFKESREVRIPGGRGGYWYRLINPSNTNQGNCFF